MLVFVFAVRLLVCLLVGWGSVSFAAASSEKAAEAAAAPDYAKLTQSFRRTLGELVAADTSNPPGNETRAVQIIGERLKAAGVTFQTMEFAPGRSNLVARLKGKGGKKPLMLLAHLDVVGADHQDWTSPPHAMTEKDGYLVGRGVSDDLGDAVANLEIFIALRASKELLERDLIFAVTGDEESGGLGIQALLKQHPDWIDAEVALNEGGGAVLTPEGKVQFVSLVVAEKVYRDFTIKAKGQTGHSSVPRGDNAITLLSEGLARLSKAKHEYHLVPAVRQYFAERAPFETGALREALIATAKSKNGIPAKALPVLLDNPRMRARIETTCVPTMIHGGTRENALPSEAIVNINCRLLPDETPTMVRQRLQAAVNDSRLVVEEVGEVGGGGSAPVTGPVPTALRTMTQKFWPGVSVITTMVLGASDSKYLWPKGIHAYGVSPLALNELDAARAHGVDERIPLAPIPDELRFWYEFVREIAK